MAKIILLFNLLSLDVALGALAGGVLLMNVLGVQMPSSWYVLLPSGLWCVYTADHLLDALRLKQNGHTPRHLFHYRNRKWIIPLLILVTAGGLYLAITRLPNEMLNFGIGLAFFSVVHLVLVKLVGERVSPLLVKELGAVIGYCCGVLAFPWIQSGREASPEMILGFAEFCMIVLLNLLIFSLFEYETDKIDGHTSFVLATGKKLAVAISGILICTVTAIASLTLFVPGYRGLRVFQGPWLIIVAVHAAILYFPSWFGKNQRYRLIGDGIFSIQWIGLFL